ncbi:MAG: methyltransferase domain-containing protein [Myxococcota bacterium]|nr:methyltransferase domain-containing protein [Myxococcota bacterium]
MTVQAKRTLKVEKLARIYDDEIAPVWGTRFGKMLLRNLAVPQKGQVLDISCGTGYPTVEILRRMSEGSRLIAIDASSAMLDVARRKVADLGPLGKKGVFFRTESAVPKLSFADDVYDLVVCNLGIDEMPSLETALRDFARVAKLHGEVRCTLPLAGTFQEFHDLYREVLIKNDKHEALERLDRHIARFPTIDHVERCMRNANLAGDVHLEEFSLLFKSSREFFFAPVIEYGPLQDWKDIAGGGQEMQDVFWYIKEAIDAYYDRGPFQVTVRAGCIIGKKHEPRASVPVEIELPHIEISMDDEDAFEDEADTGLPLPPNKIAVGSVRMNDPDDLEVVEVAPESLDFDIDESIPEEQLDAFIEGAKRPSHLDDFDD